MFAYHDHYEEHEHTSESVSSQDEAVVEKRNPFSVLAQLKEKLVGAQHGCSAK